MGIKKPFKSKSIKSKTHPDMYSGERSPYWEFMESHQSDQHEGRITEDPFANPDEIDEAAGIYKRPLTELGQFQLEIISEIVSKLSPQEQKVLELCGFEGWTLAAAATKLGVTVATIQTVLNRVRAKIKRRFEQQKKADL